MTATANVAPRTPCIHWWVCPLAPFGQRTVRATCKRCGEEREFLTSLPDVYFDFLNGDATPEKQRERARNAGAMKLALRAAKERKA